MKTKSLDEFLASPDLYRHVDLSNQSINDEECQRIAETLVDATQLVHLDLSNNQIGNAGFFELAKVFTSIDTILKTLYLHNNHANYNYTLLCMAYSVAASDADEINFLPKNHPEKSPQPDDWCVDTAFKKEAQKFLPKQQHVNIGKKRMRDDTPEKSTQPGDWYANLTFEDSGDDENIALNGDFDFGDLLDEL